MLRRLLRNAVSPFKFAEALITISPKVCYTPGRCVTVAYTPTHPRLTELTPGHNKKHNKGA